MKTLIVLALFVTTSAFANITCKGAIRLAVGDGQLITDAMNRLPVTSGLALMWLDREEGNLGNIKAACEEGDDLSELCEKLPAINSSRESGIIWNITGTEEQREKVRVRNNDLRKQTLIICK